MSEYEGKVPRRKRPVNLIDVLYYEATGEMIPPDVKERTLKRIEEDKENDR